MTVPGCFRSIFFSYFALAIASCGLHSRDTSTYIGTSTKTISVNTATGKSADFSDIFEIKKAIRLATNDSVIIGRIDKIICTEKRIYILDGKTNYIDIFDNFGRFLFKISAIGDGYGKYFRIADFDVDNKAILIYLLDDFNRKMIFFSDSDGHLIGEKPLFNFTVNKFLLSNTSSEHHVIYSRGGTAESDNMWYNILITDTTNQVLEHFLPYVSTRTFILSPVQPLQRTTNSISYLPPFSNVIFELSPNQMLSAKYILNFTGSNADFEKMQADLRENRLPTIGDFFHYLNENNYIEFLNFLETDSLLYISYTSPKQGNEFFIYQKNSGSSLLISTIRHNYLNFSGRPVGIFRDQFIYLLQPDSFLDKEKLRPELPPDDRYLLDNFSTKDNPILVMIKAKPF